MSICIAALILFAFMGIFSAKYRKWAREAFGCVVRRVTLRPCKTEFNEKVRAKITSKLLRRHIGLARFTHKHFESISWTFTIVLFVSLFISALGTFNLLVYGTCDPSNPDSCPFTFNQTTQTCSPMSECQPCLCGSEQIGCEDPEYLACGGNCDCIQDICGG